MRTGHDVVDRPRNAPQAVRPAADPQLNVVLGSLGVSFIVGALVFGRPDHASGALFVLAVAVGLALFCSRSGVSPARLLLVALVAAVVGEIGGAGEAAVALLGMALGSVMGLASVGLWSWRRPWR